MPSARDLRSLAAAFADIADEAGTIILDIKRRGVETMIKADASPVTEADQAAEKHIIQRLRDLLPDVPLIAEEQVSAGVLPEAGRIFLLVDPLDGTREFVAGRAEYTVNIALVEDGAPVVGVVGAPELGRLYAGAPGWAGRRDGTDKSFRAIATRTMTDPPVAVTSISHRDPQTEAWLTRWGRIDRCCIGSSLKFALLAEGQADVYPRFGPTLEWDTAAGHAVLTAAGGVVLKPDNTAFTYGKREEGYRNGAFIAWGRAPS
ncbi:3'(2'),5'-bisphosphate nucleotidase CysQ [Agaricicola taiwanensis]|uniref:3'(2'),5'-bisphosphate nucleotidase CysQ n=2 Tax=Agaricicola taiwanensis TaxID=591372 RepID=A0A8J2YH13_9RHOB|nr:3'(2'),5'-bisphosphate nucleotidase CysQ [Agaricicola taiwanensis]